MVSYPFFKFSEYDTKCLVLLFWGMHGQTKNFKIPTHNISTYFIQIHIEIELSLFENVKQKWLLTYKQTDIII